MDLEENFNKAYLRSKESIELVRLSIENRYTIQEDIEEFNREMHDVFYDFYIVAFTEGRAFERQESLKKER